MEFAQYLGDGVYIDWDGYQFCLMANSHSSPTDKIYLEPEILETFLKYIETFKREATK